MNSKRKGNLYSVRKDGKVFVTRSKWSSNIPGHPNYRVTKFGRVYHLVDQEKHLWKRISVYTANKLDGGYLKCKIDLESWLLHRLVATVHLPNPNNLPVVMHLDNNKQNCRVSNLKWGTILDNTLQAWFDGCFTKTPKNVLYYQDVHHLFNSGYSIYEISKILPIHISSVKRILKGKGSLLRFRSKFNK